MPARRGLQEVFLDLVAVGLEQHAGGTFAAGLVGGEGFAVDASLIQAMPSIADQDWRRDRDPARSKQLFYLASI